MTQHGRVLIPVLLVTLCVATTARSTVWLIQPDGMGDAPTIQAGVSSAVSGDTILLTPGTYTGAGNRDIDYMGKELVLTSQSGAASTIIDCENAGRGFFIHSNEGPAAVISGVKIRQGNAQDGGGIYVRTAQPTIVDNIITNCTATGDGGGIHYGASAGTPPDSEIRGNEITNCTAGGQAGGILAASRTTDIIDNVITGNTADLGGGISTTNSLMVLITGNTIAQNHANFLGGGVYDDGLGCTYLDNEIRGNSSGDDGGGIYVTVSDPEIENCLFKNNTCTFFGGAVYCASPADPTFRNCTFVENTGGGVILANNSSPKVERSIVAFNNSTAFFCFGSGSVAISCSDVFGNLSDGVCQADSGSNISSDPLFCDPLLGDYSIAPTSPCTPSNSPCGELIGAFPPCISTATGDFAPGADTVLHANFPNPFNPTTTIRYDLAAGGRVTLRIYDVAGRIVSTLVDEHQSAGAKTVVWDGVTDAGEHAASGIYFYRLTTAGFDRTRKMVLIK